MYIDEVTENHAQAVGRGNYENETIIELKSEGSIRCAAYPAEVDYVRVCDCAGRELMYWHADEFSEDFGSVMGAFLGLAYEVSKAV